jgi:hypothetical protein
MAIGFTDPRRMYDGSYDEARRQYEAQERMRVEEMMRAQKMYNTYNANTDTYGGVTAKQIQEGQKPKPLPDPEYLKNDKLLLLEN